MRGQALLAAGMMALTASIAVPTAASAQSYQGAPYAAPVAGYGTQACKDRKVKNSVLGGLFGAALGAVVGSNMSRGGHRSDNGIIGGVLGGAAGATIGASGTNCAAAAYGEPAPPPYAGQPAPPPYDQYGQYGGQNRGQYGDDELLGGPYGDDRYSDRGGSYRNDGRRYAYNQECTTAERVVRDRYGYARRVPVEMCRDPRSGEWVIQR